MSQSIEKKFRLYVNSIISYFDKILTVIMQLKNWAPSRVVCIACPIDSASSQLILSSSMATRLVDRLRNSGRITSKGLLIANQAHNCRSVSLSFFLLITDISACCTELSCFDLVRSVIASSMPDTQWVIFI